MKILKKHAVILLLFIILIITNLLIVPPVKANDGIINPNEWEPVHFSNEDAKIAGDITGKIFVTIRNVGVLISVLVITIIGIKYMICSVEEKAQYKETAIPLIVGCFLLAGSTTLVNLIYTIATS